MKQIIGVVLAFLVLVGCMNVYQRETVMLANQQQAIQAIQTLDQRLRAVEQFLQKQIEMSQKQAVQRGSV